MLHKKTSRSESGIIKNGFLTNYSSTDESCATQCSPSYSTFFATSNYLQFVAILTTLSAIPLPTIQLAQGEDFKVHLVSSFSPHDISLQGPVVYQALVMTCLEVPIESTTYYMIIFREIYAEMEEIIGFGDIGGYVWYSFHLSREHNLNYVCL